MYEKYKALIFAPLPPPIGGIASIVAMLQNGFAGRSDVSIISPLPKGKGFMGTLVRPLVNSLKLAFAVNKTDKGSRILIFSSEGSSFYEKIFWSFLILVFGRKPVVVMVSGLFPKAWTSLNYVLKKILSCFIDNSDIVLVAQSDMWRSYYRTIFSKVDIQQIKATVAEEFFSYKKLPAILSSPPRLLYVGWITQDKGIFDLLDAMEILVRNHPNVVLRLVGPMFGKEDEWHQAATNRGLSQQVEYLGPVTNRSKLIEELVGASIFVFPSHFEGFPVALLEAIAMGVPCVATTVGGIPDILDNGRAGLLVEKNSPIELSAALESLIADKNLCEQISERASQRAKEMFSQSEFMESYMRVLRLG